MTKHATVDKTNHAEDNAHTANAYPKLVAALRYVMHDLIVERAHRNTGTIEHGSADRLRAERELLAPHFGDVPGSVPIGSGLACSRALLRELGELT